MGHAVSDWNLFFDRMIELGPTLTKAEHRLALVIARSTLGFRVTEEGLGERLLRDKAQLHGRSFGQAREGLVAKGLITYSPPDISGRGQRGRYRLLLEPACDEPTREANADGTAQHHGPAPVRAFGPISPAESTAERPALERARIEEPGKDDDEAVETLLRDFDTPSATQRQEFVAAYATHPKGFVACVEQARSGAKPVALLTTLVRQGVHRRPQGSVTVPPNPTRHLEEWLAGTGQALDPDDVQIVLADSFGLAGEEHHAALERWWNYRGDRHRGTAA